MPKAKICRRRGQRMLQRLITRRISHAQVLQYTAGKPIFCRGHLQRSPRCKCVRPSGKLAAPGVSENKLLARRCRKLTGQRQNGKRQPPPVKLLPKQSCSNRGGSRTLSMHWLKEAPKISACKVSGSCASASG